MAEVTRKQLVGALNTTADLLDVLGQEPFRANAYRGAARSLEATETPVADLVATGFAGVPKVGKAIAADLTAFATTGVFTPLEEAAAQVDPGVMGLFRVRGLGPKKIRALWDAGIDSLETLREAARDGRVAALKGFGAKSAGAILEAVEFVLGAQDRQHLSTGLDVSETLAAWLDGLEARVAGDARRGLETVRTSRLTVTGTADEVTARLAGRVADLAPVDPKPLLSGRLDGVPVEIAYAPAGARGALDLMMGGGSEYRESLRAKARAQGFDLSGRGLKREGVLIPTPTEGDVTRALDLPLRPAEYRDPEHNEVWETLPPPAELVTAADLKGMLHTHSVWSDGAATLPEMVEEAVRLGGPSGGTFLGTGDHSRAAHYANGMSIERLRAYVREIRELQRAGLPILAGAEVDILEDGSLDYPDEELLTLDYVVASVHSHFTLDAGRQTDRLVRAVSHPLITILGHPTGRLLLRRPGYALDLDAVLAAAAGSGTVVEINANPARLDLDWRFALRWRDRLTFAINTDAHVPAGLGDTRYGVAVARKAGLTPEKVVNTLGQEEFLAFVRRQREGRG
ncbi:DNA polymerase/3'-5' exonuclease PolX [Deinococcus metallilatus]|uniref:DNA polymerase (Family 10) n=1 Tax=Deinococcus metallilatus TaxID=1211322 RepID=A0AAJ5JY88_9DEIO|nr:helix-hairpin-helix domain-containing protein [Deinococcus metallilatus]MBB5296045.1 DNA polymerase (family 10) [Deinococcus metallilatus]QBY08143.1 DNA polymerase/3'-5' exonuclease PolX [Deinococcus metallilatus]RXJ11875.1 DNA polymerase/3'-5' exonuclease PolX [Deinococcus metallilatus]TLK25893.1 DNA polymerase/3'-5' exonuclease PolX [Deinococcus metallilatus]GMA14418.1 DNA polymerase/3'-5' exonuclease PolX [Deinococcus metallilatus]